MHKITLVLLLLFFIIRLANSDGNNLEVIKCDKNNLRVTLIPGNNFLTAEKVFNYKNKTYLIHFDNNTEFSWQPATNPP